MLGCGKQTTRSFNLFVAAPLAFASDSKMSTGARANVRNPVSPPEAEQFLLQEAVTLTALPELQENTKLEGQSRKSSRTIEQSEADASSQLTIR